jgi:serine/threonine protein kinase
MPRLAHYEILKRLGTGSMGVVYKARDIRLGRLVALKLLSPDLRFDPTAKERFREEARAASCIDHPNVCTVYEIDESAEGQLFIAMAYCEGETLQQQLRRGLLQLPRVIDIITQTAAGLTKLHSHAIVHQDIKPANLLVAREGNVKIVDFGLAQLGGSGLARERAMMGTPAYMSPEQIRADGIDHRSDIWSVGVLLYEMLTGQLPFQGQYYQEIIYSILSEEPKPLKQHRADLPEEFDDIIRRKALAKSADTRYQRVDEISSALRALQENALLEAANYPMEPDELFGVVGQTGVAAFVVQPSGEICYWSDEAAKLLGFSEAEVVSRYCADVIDAQDHSGCSFCTHNCSVLSLALDGAQVLDHVLRMSTASGQRELVRVSTIPVRVRTGPSPLIVHTMKSEPEQSELGTTLALRMA